MVGPAEAGEQGGTGFHNPIFQGGVWAGGKWLVSTSTSSGTSNVWGLNMYMTVSKSGTFAEEPIILPNCYHAQ